MMIAHELSHMAWIIVIFISVLSCSVVRIFVRTIGREKNAKLKQKRIFFVLISVPCATFLIGRAQFYFFVPAISVALVAIFERFKKNRRELLDLSPMLEEIIMTMQTGVSFEPAAREICAKNGAWNRIFHLSESEKGQKIPMTNGQNDMSEELLKIFTFCRINPSLAYKNLNSLRQTLRLRAQLQQKQTVLTLQARAQAIVSSLLFIILCGVQWIMNPDFQVFIISNTGRWLFLFSVALTAAGIALVFRIALPKELSL
jgi:Flp pilus assembly protein TadB